MRAMRYFVLLFILVMLPLLFVESHRDWISTASLIASLAFIYSLIRNTKDLAAPAFVWFIFFFLVGLGSVSMGPILNNLKNPNSAYTLSVMFQDTSHHWNPIFNIGWITNLLHNDITLLISWILQMVVMVLFFFKLIMSEKQHTKKP